MELFTINEKGFPIINIELKTIACFKKIFERDKSKNKELATAEAAYIYWESKYGSPYLQEYRDSNKRLEIIKQEVGLDKAWKPSDDIIECCEWFRNSQRTKTMRLVETIEKVVDSLSNYFDNLDLTETIKEGSHKGELKHDVTKVQKAVKDIPETVRSVKEMKEIVNEEITQKQTGKAGREINKFES